MRTSRPRRRASSRPALAVATGSPGSENTGTSICRPSVRSCSTAAGRWRSAPTSSGLRPCCLNQRRELGGVGGLAGALEAGHQHDGGRLAGVGDLDGLAAEDGDELLVDDLDDLLRRVQRLRQVHPDGALADAIEHRADDLEVDVRLEQGDADLPQDLVDVLLAEPPLAAELLEDPVEPVRQCLEHEGPMLPARRLSVQPAVDGSARGAEDVFGGTEGAEPATLVRGGVPDEGAVVLGVEGEGAALVALAGSAQSATVIVGGDPDLAAELERTAGALAGRRRRSSRRRSRAARPAEACPGPRSECGQVWTVWVVPRVVGPPRGPRRAGARGPAPAPVR